MTTQSTTRSRKLSEDEIASWRKDSRTLSTSSLTGLISSEALVSEHADNISRLQRKLSSAENDNTGHNLARDRKPSRGKRDPHIPRGSASKFTLYITGHSLGGALATLCALELRCRFEFSPRLYTFGTSSSPRRKGFLSTKGCSMFSCERLPVAYICVLSKL